MKQENREIHKALGDKHKKTWCKLKFQMPMLVKECLIEPNRWSNLYQDKEIWQAAEAIEEEGKKINWCQTWLGINSIFIPLINMSQILLIKVVKLELVL